jgi:hypothetical protein
VIDPWNGLLLVDAVVTRDRATTEHHSLSSLDPASQRQAYPNRIIRDRCKRWERYVAAASLLLMAGRLQPVAFEEHPLYDSLASRLINIAVLCPRGKTYNRAPLFSDASAEPRYVPFTVIPSLKATCTRIWPCRDWSTSESARYAHGFVKPARTSKEAVPQVNEAPFAHR